MDRFELLRTELTRRCPGLELREEEPMARHTSFRIGGPARLMALPRTEEGDPSGGLGAGDPAIFPGERLQSAGGGPGI